MMQHHHPHILVVDDDVRLGQLLCEYLSHHMFEVTATENPLHALEICTWWVFDALILDMMMPEMSGFTLLQTLQQRKIQVPTLFLSAKNDAQTRITGLTLGAYDYLAKPFEPDELRLRLVNILRHNQEKNQRSALVHFGQRSFNTQTNVLSHGSAPIPLGALEQKILNILIACANTICTRDKLNAALGYSLQNPRSIDVAIQRLRLKIEPNPRVPQFLQTIRHKGYRLCIPSAS